MQDPGAFGVLNQGFPEEQDQQQLKCPRCDSFNTKFCYYNNYNLSQPRYYCKACRRYWTKGGSLRNIPVGGASRKPTKRSAKRRGPKPEPELEPGSAPSTTTGQGEQLFGGSGLLLEQGLPCPNGPGQANGLARNLGFGSGLGGLDQLQSGDQESSCNWSGNSDTTTTTTDNNNNNGWPDLAVYTPDSRFQ